jgi:hypothetical protein
MSRNTTRILRAQQMSAMIEKYLASGLAQRAFCARLHLTWSTFHYWLRKYRAAHPRARAQTNAQEFIPLRIKRDHVKAPSPTPYEIEYPNGVIVRLAGLNPQQLSELIHLTAQ